MKKFSMLALACTFVVACAGSALAEGFAVYEWSARGVALGGTTVARTPDPSVLASNPAGMSGLKGTQVQAGLSLIMPYGKIQFDDPVLGARQYEKDQIEKDNWFMPSFYFSHQFNDRLSLGLAEYTRFGLGFKYDPSWVGSQNIYEVGLTTASLTPVVSYKITDKLSLGAGVEAMYLDITLKKTKAIGNGASADFDIEGDNVAFGGLIGLHYQLNDQWAFGATYRSQVKHNVDGKAKITSPAVVPGLVDQDVSATVTMPESVTFGVAYAPIKPLSVEVGATWTRWSRFQNLDLDFDKLGTIPNTKNWKNTWRFNVGVEYQATDWMALRAGYVWDGCPVNDQYADYLIPTDGRNIYSLGAGFNYGDWTLDLAYAFVDPNERTYNSRQADGVYAGETYGSGTNIVSASIGYKF